MNIKPRRLTDEEIELVMQMTYMDGEPMMIVSEGVRDIGEILRIKRTADNLRIRDLAKQFKITPGVLSEIERGVRTIPRGKEKAVEDYIYKQLYLNGRLEFRMDDDEDDDGEYTAN